MDNKELEKKVREKEAEIESGKPKDKKSTVKYIINISVVLIATGLAIFFAMKDDAGQIFKMLGTADWRFLAVVLGLMAGCILIRSFILFAFAHLFTRTYHFHQALNPLVLKHFISAPI